MEQWILAYGYLAVFVCSCIEGEVGILLAGAMCKRGLMSASKVILVAFLGTMFWELCIFFIGRKWGNNVIEKFPKLRKRSKKAFEFLNKYDSLFIFSFRFIYGIRNASPLVIGAAGINPIKYAILNMFAAALWAVLFTSLGYAFSDGIHQVLGAIIRNFKIVSICALCALVVLAVVFISKTTKTRKRTSQEQK